MRWYLAAVMALSLAMPSIAQTAPTSPMPLTPVQQWFSGDNYPAASMRAGEEGDVSALLSIDAQGVVTACRITQSSGHPLLDQATCRLAARRGRFTPATDARGRPIAGTYAIDHLNWRMRGIEAPIAPAPVGTAPASASSTMMPTGTGGGDQDAVRGAASGLQSLSGPPLPATLSVTPQRLRTAAPLWNALNLEPGIRAVAAIQYRSLLGQVAAGTASLPIAMQQRAKDDFRAAYDAALQRYVVQQRDNMVRYAAARLDDRDIGVILPFLSGGIGYKMAHDAGSMTPQDREEVGRAELEHPEVAKLVKVQLDFAQATLAERTTATRAFYADVHNDFCGRVATERFVFSSCPGRKH